MRLNTTANIIDGESVRLNFEWSPTDPLAVKMSVIDLADEIIEWTFGVDLLKNGGGIADVKITHHPAGHTLIALASDTGEATLAVPRTFGLHAWANTIPDTPEGSLAENMGDWELEIWVDSLYHQ